MDTSKHNSNQSTNTAGFPPAPSETHKQAGGVKPKKVRLNVRNEVKALNGKKGRGSYFVRVKLSTEWNEIKIVLTDGTCNRAETFVDLGHTAESKQDAINEVRGTVEHFLAL